MIVSAALDHDIRIKSSLLVRLQSPTSEVHMWLRGTVAVNLLSVFLGTSPVSAQDASQPLKEYAIDANGMDLSNGRFTLPGPRLEIGNDDSGLSHATIGSPNHNGATVSYVDNYSNSIWTAPGPSWGDPGGPIFATVSIDGVTRMFLVGYWTDHTSTQSFYSSPYQGDGPEKLTCPTGITSGTGTCTLTTADGGSVVYDLSYHYLSPPNYVVRAQRGVATQINRADGEIVRINYTGRMINYAEWQKKTVWSSLGWMLKYSYTGSGDLNGIYSYNLSQTYCDPEALSCAGSPTYPYLTVAVSGSTRTFLRNNIPVYQYSYVSAYQATRSDPLWDTVSYEGVGFADGNTGLRTDFSIKRGNSEWIYSRYYWNEYPPYYREIVLEWDITDPKNGKRHVNVNRDSQVTSIRDELLRKTIFRREAVYSTASPRPKYILPLLIPYVISPEGSEASGKIEYKYHLGRVSEIKNISKISSDPALLTKLTYGCVSALCASKPTEITNPANKSTKYDYYSTHGLLEKETGPADANGVTPQKRYYYDQLYPKILNASGALVNADPVWKLVRVSECAAATSENPASCVGTAAEIVTTYAYNNNNLLRTAETIASGNGSTSATTTSAYDAVGNLIAVDGPRTDVDDRTYTTYDLLRRPVFEIGADPDGAGGNPRSIVKHNYDSVGREFLTEFGIGTATDGSDFAVRRFTRMSFDPATGVVVKKEEGQP